MQVTSDNYNKIFFACQRDIQDILKHHQWPDGVLEKTTKDIAVVDRKLSDKSLYLGVIGEFNSGKSTLINSFIEDPLLSTDVLQATTSSATILKHNKTLDVLVEFNDGTIKQFSCDGISWLDSLSNSHANIISKVLPFSFNKKSERQREQVRFFLNEVTANEDVAKNIALVQLLHPSPVLANGMVIVDTPGTNANNHRHTQVARQAIHDLCDAVIVVIPLNIPLPAGFVDFLRQTVDGAFHRCIFVGTKIDILRVKDYNRMESFLIDKLKTEFNLESPTLYMLSPMRALEEMEQSGVGEDLSSLRNVRQQIMDTMQRQRHLIQAEKIGGILSSMIYPLGEILSERQRAYDMEHQALIDNMVSNVDAIWMQRASEAISYFQSNLRSIERSTVAEVIKLLDDAQDEMKKNINAASSISNLKERAELLGNVSQAYELKVPTSIDAGIKSAEMEALHIFKKYINSFQESYRKLATLGGTIKMKEECFSSNGIFNNEYKLIPSSFVGTIAIAKEANFDEDVAFGGGFTGGALLGQILIPIPVVGAVIGGLFGSFLGMFFAPDISDVKKKCHAEISSSIAKSKSDAEKKIKSIFDQLSEHLSSQMKILTTEAYKAYQKLATEMRERDEVRKLELKAVQKIVDDDLNVLHEHATTIDKILVKLRNT